MTDQPSLPLRATALTRGAWLRLAAGLAVLALALAFPGQAWQTAVFVADNLIRLLPLLAFAIGLTSYLAASALDGQIARIFTGRGGRVIFGAAIFGALTPVCGLGLLPLIARLLAAGAPLAPIMAFWLASPIMGPSLVLVTAGTLGLTMALAKTLAAAGIGLLGGAATAVLVARGAFTDPLKASGVAAHAASCQIGGPVLWAFWREAARRRLFWSEAAAASWLVLKWLSLAFALESLLRAHLPPELIAGYLGAGTPWAIPLAVAVGTPIYLDGYAALPLVRGLVELGMTPGAALAFLVAGAITSAYASVAVFALVRWPVFLWYLLLAVVGATLAGYGMEIYGLAFQ